MLNWVHLGKIGYEYSPPPPPPVACFFWFDVKTLGCTWRLLIGHLENTCLRLSLSLLIPQSWEPLERNSWGGDTQAGGNNFSRILLFRWKVSVKKDVSEDRAWSSWLSGDRGGCLWLRPHHRHHVSAFGTCSWGQTRSWLLHGSIAACFPLLTRRCPCEWHIAVPLNAWNANVL